MTNDRDQEFGKRRVDPVVPKRSMDAPQIGAPKIGAPAQIALTAKRNPLKTILIVGVCVVLLPFLLVGSLLRGLFSRGTQPPTVAGQPKQMNEDRRTGGGFIALPGGKSTATATAPSGTVARGGFGGTGSVTSGSGGG